MTWDTSDLDAFIRDVSKAGPKAEELSKVVVKKIGFDTVAGAQGLAPVDTGNLKNSIGMDPIGDWDGFEAGPTANYGAYVEYGVEAHEIKPRSAKALWWEGAEHPVASVQHPGQAPQPYMGPAFDKATKPLDKLFGQVGEKALE